MRAPTTTEKRNRIAHDSSRRHDSRDSTETAPTNARRSEAQRDGPSVASTRHAMRNNPCQQCCSSSYHDSATCELMHAPQRTPESWPEYPNEGTRCCRRGWLRSRYTCKPTPYHGVRRRLEETPIPEPPPLTQQRPARDGAAIMGCVLMMLVAALALVVG